MLLLPVLLRELELDAIPAASSRRYFARYIGTYFVQINITRGGGKVPFFTLVSILLDFR